tara:strand:+ start:137 stop:508 length:372 start_codon:yes stop_codon:yes gene_type:complete
MSNSFQPYYTVISSLTVSSVSGSGPSYTVTYTGSTSNAKIGDKVIVEKREAGEGTDSDILSTYTYIVTGTDTNELTIKYEYDTAGLGDDSPADLYSGGGSSGDPEKAPHLVGRLTSTFILFVD